MCCAPDGHFTARQALRHVSEVGRTRSEPSAHDVVCDDGEPHIARDGAKSPDRPLCALTDRRPAAGEAAGLNVLPSVPAPKM